jgi:hypothetical protein
MYGTPMVDADAEEAIPKETEQPIASSVKGGEPPEYRMVKMLAEDPDFMEKLIEDYGEGNYVAMNPMGIVLGKDASPFELSLIRRKHPKQYICIIRLNRKKPNDNLVTALRHGQSIETPIQKLQTGDRVDFYGIGETAYYCEDGSGKERRSLFLRENGKLEVLSFHADGIVGRRNGQADSFIPPETVYSTSSDSPEGRAFSRFVIREQ